MQLHIGVTRVVAGDGSQADGAVLSCPACHRSFPLAEAEISRRRAVGARHRGPGITVSEIMTRDVVCVRDDVSADALTALLLEHGLHGAPVVDDAGVLIGFVSMTDLLRDRHDRGETDEAVPLHVSTRTGGYDLGAGFHLAFLIRTTVRELMTPRPISVEDTAPLALASVIMASRGVHRLPVVSERGTLVGIVSSLDLARWLANDPAVLGQGSKRAQRGRRPL
jgi:CBS domain-containing protein